MCAPLEAKMESRSISRINSQSTGVTLVGSDEVVSPLTVIDSKLQAASPILQTPDQRQWIDLDVLSPKLLRELRKQYDTQPSDQQRPLAKGAAKLKAWTRQTKLGFDVRLRRKLSLGHDQVTDFCIVQDPMPWNDQKQLTMPELSSEGVFELPDTSRISELPTEAQVLEANELLNEAEDEEEETLPRYPGPAQPPRLIIPVNTVEGDNLDGHSRSPSASSIVATPTEGLAIQNWDQQLETSKKDGAEHLEPGLQDVEMQGDGRKPLTERQSSQHDRVATELVNVLLSEIRENLLKQQSSETLPKTSHKVAKKFTYETQTDAEPPSPSDESSRRKSPRSKAKARQSLKVRSKPKKKAIERIDSLHAPNREANLPQTMVQRHSTVPKRPELTDGPEAIWDATLKGQKKILGGEHPLTWKAKYALAESRSKQHQNCPDELLESLRESEKVSVSILGSVHPDVAAFSANLKSLAILILKKGATGSMEAPGVVVEDEMSQPPKIFSTLPADDSSKSNGEVDIKLNAMGTTPDSPQMHLSPPASYGEHWTNSALPKLQTDLLSESEKNDEDLLRDRMAMESLWSSWKPPHRPRSNVRVLFGLLFEALTNSTVDGISWLQQNYGPEPAPAAGKVRVRWTCSCGESLYDDFEERKPGAARELEAYLNRPRTRTTPGTPVSPNSSTDSRSFSSSLGAPPSSQTSWSSFGQSTRGSYSRDEKPQQSLSTLPIYTPFTPLADPPWLLVCANEDQHSPKVAHLDMSPHKIKSDRDLAKELRSHYSFINRRWWQRFLKLRGLTTIHFVQFECHQNRFADIRKTPDMPPRGTEYSFEPAELIPPVGSQYLLHLFKHPEEYDGEVVAYVRVPKKNGRLALGVGWGVHLVEGFMPERVWMCVNLFFAFVSLVFAIAWACERNDIQGAFGVAQWICSLAFFAGGWVQACLT